MKQLAVRLNAAIHSPAEQTPSFLDKVRAKLVGTPLLWAFARDLASKLSKEDVLYCPDEAIGLPLAYLCSRLRSRPNLVVMVHNVERPRTRLALKLNAGFSSADVFVSGSQRQLDFLRVAMKITNKRTIFVANETDLNFFRPGPPFTGKKRPLLVSAGLERRDYKILAEATKDLDLDVAVTGFSADAAAGTSSFPEIWPANFSRRRYDWLELAQLYRDADAVVVTLLPNIYAAGITSIIEGMASAQPVVVTRTDGLKGYLEDDDALTLVKPGDVADLRSAIEVLTNDHKIARSRGLRAAEIANERYGSESYVEKIASIMQAFEPT